MAEREIDERREKGGAPTEAERAAQEGGRHLGGPTGGDVFGAGGGPAIGKKHPADKSSAEHYGSPRETQEALERKVASENFKRLKER